MSEENGTLVTCLADPSAEAAYHDHHLVINFMSINSTMDSIVLLKLLYYKLWLKLKQHALTRIATCLALPLDCGLCHGRDSISCGAFLFPTIHRSFHLSL